MGRLDGKVAMISGGARGQGAVEAKMFAQEGAKVVFGDILDDEGRKVEAEIRELGGEATYVHLDVSQEADWQKAVQTAAGAYGKLNVLVNNAGIASRKTIEETSVEDWDNIFAINARGVFLGTKHSIPEMRKAGGGSIVNISSAAGIAPSPGTAASYAATKGAVRLFTKAAANPTRPGPDPVQLGPPRARGYPHGAHPRVRSLPGGHDGQQGAPGEDRGSRGDRLRCAIPGLRRVLLYDRVGAGGGWRQDGPVAPEHQDAGPRSIIPSARRESTASIPTSP